MMRAVAGASTMCGWRVWPARFSPSCTWIRPKVAPGRLKELKAAMDDLTEFVEANEPRLIAYNVYFSDDAGPA